MDGFTLIMAVYANEDPLFLKQCLDSVFSQSVAPGEFIIIKNGPLTCGLDEVINDIRSRSGVRIIALPRNMTLGPARAEAVRAARHEWIAVMDSDDVCRPGRFEKQIALISGRPGLGLIGGQIAEFRDDPKQPIAIRSVPTGHAEIVKFARKRNPFNHMTVMFKRELAIKAGNYDYFPGFEDYDLWARMIMGGVVCANHPDVLVDARVGSGMYERRHGAAYIKSELRMQKQLMRLGMINYAEYARNIALRVPIRLLPAKGLEHLYNLWRI